MSEIKTTENGLEIEANKITLEGPKTEYVTLAVVEYNPNEALGCEGNATENALVRLPTFCHQVSEGDTVTFTRGSIFTVRGRVLIKVTYDVEDPRLHMLMLMESTAPAFQDPKNLPVVETKIEEVRVTR